MIDRARGTESALSVLVARGLPTAGDSLIGRIEDVGRFDESSGRVVPAAVSDIPAGSTICVTGWAADLRANGSAAGVCVHVGDIAVDALYGLWRDVAGETRAGDELAHTGFRGYVTLDGARRGDLPLSATVVSADARSAAALAGARSIRVIPGRPSVAIETERRAGSAYVQVDAWCLEAGHEVPIDGPLVVQRGALIGVRGWVRDVHSDSPAAGVFARVDDHLIVYALGWQPRPDVAAATHDDRLVASGFTVRVDTVALEPGWHALQIGIVTADGAAYDLDERRFAFAVSPDQR